MTSEQLKNLQFQTIDWLRFPLAVAVVFVHCFGTPSEYTLPSLNVSLSGIDIYNLIRICFSHVLAQVAVPIFYLISGFLFFLNLDEFNFKGVYLKKIKSRFHTLIIPYILWNVISILSIIALKFLAFLIKGNSLSNILEYFHENRWFHLFWDCNMWGDDRVNWLGIGTPYTGPSDLPLWFLRDLIVVVLLTPIIYWLIKHFRHYFLLILSLLYISGIWPIIPGLSITATFFFSVGAYFSIRSKNLVEEFKRVRIISYILGMLLLFITIMLDGRNTFVGSLIFPFWVIIGVCAIFNLAIDVVRSGRLQINSFLSKSSFFIFAIHTILISQISTILSMKLLYWNTPLVLTIRYFVTPFLAVSICLLLYYLMRKYVPTVLNIVTGKR